MICIAEMELVSNLVRIILFMKTKLVKNYASKIFLLSGVISLSSSYLNAWTVSVLVPNTTLPNYSAYDGSGYSQFRGLLTGAGSTLTSGTLGSYIADSSDAVIVNVIESAHEYTSAELSVLTDLLNSNTRILLFGENSGWNKSNSQLASLLGGISSDSDGSFVQTVSNIYPLITEGVSQIEIPYPGKISPSGSNGLSLSSDAGVSLWGNNNHFLLMMDINGFQDSYIHSRDNYQLAGNIANWISGVDITPTPEPSAYAITFGLSALGIISLRRQRKR